MLYYLRDHPATTPEAVADLAASYQEAVGGSLVDRARRAVARHKAIAAVGGVSLNSRLREKLKEACDKSGVRLLLAPREFCADNAAMIAGLAGAGLGYREPDVMSLDVNPSLPIGWR